jgi:hypothetical protein
MISRLRHGRPGWGSKGALAVTALAAAVVAGIGLTAAAAAPAGPAVQQVQTGAGVTDQPVLPSWAIGPFTRYDSPQNTPYQGNPVLTPQGTGWEGRAAYNPGVVYNDGKFQMLY